MARELVSKKELISILTNKLSKYEVCKDCYFDGILKYEEEVGDICNWLGANVKFRCSDESDESCRPFISRILSEAGNKYNVTK